MTINRVFLIILDSVGCGALPDAEEFGDTGSNTLGNTARVVGGLDLPELQALGLGNIVPLEGMPPATPPLAAYGKMKEASRGKDTTTGHWELAGLRLDRAFPLFPHGFPEEILAPFREATGRGVLGNKPASGTAIIDELGAEHRRTGDLIVYTSGDSVFQVAAHTDVVPLPELYAACEAARQILDPYGVGRVIARPFEGEPGSYRRTYDRRDYSVAPPEPTVLDRLAAAGLSVVGIGKIHDIFVGHGVTEEVHTEGNADGLARTVEVAGRLPRGLVFVNLVDFDSLYGHRNNPQGYYEALREFDRWVPSFRQALRPGDLAIFTADHGNDPTTQDTDHDREYVPLLAFGDGVRAVPLGVRETFADVAATVADVFGVTPPAYGQSFLGEIT